MKEKLIQIINELIEAIKDSNIDTVREEIVFQEAIRIYNTQQINMKKSYQKNYYSKEKTTSPYNFKEDPATDKQKYAIKQAGKQIPAGLTKIEASRIIKQIKDGKI